MNEILNRAWLAHTGSPTAKIVLVSLADHADKDGKCWPSIPRLAKRCELSERAVELQIKTLETRGHLVVERAKGIGNKYLVCPKSVTSEPRSPANDVRQRMTFASVPRSPHQRMTFARLANHVRSYQRTTFARTVKEPPLNPQLTLTAPLVRCRRPS